MRETKIRVNKTEYVPSKHIMLWAVTFVDENDSRYGKDITLAYRANDLASAFLGRDDIQVTPEGAIEFNENVEGRVINLIEHVHRPEADNLKAADAEQLLDYNVKLRDYPFEEVFDILSGSE